jgi:DNA invertase Pin-like site-specific DNA recombinase
VVLVHSFSRFFRDQFQLEFYVRQLAKNGVRLVSITQELGDDPMSNMIRQIMALFDEYQSKENAKHTLRSMKENARQGFWNGALPPIGYRIVEAAEQRGHRIKKTLEVDPIQAETVRLIYRLAREGNGSSGPMGIKSIAKHLNEAGIRTRDGGRWGVDAVHKVLARTTYIGRHRFNTKFWKSRERKPEAEVVEMAVPPIIDQAEFEAVQMLLKSRSPALTAPRVVSGPTLLTGICFCAGCGGAMTLRTGKSGDTGTTFAAPRPGRVRPAARAAPFPWRSWTRSWPSTSSTAFCSPSASSKSYRPSFMAGKNAPSAERRILPNCASVHPKRKPNSSGSTTRSKTASLTCPIRCSRSA